MLGLSGAACHAPPSVSPGPAVSADSASGAKVTRRFYASRPYGSEAQFNPLSLVVNGGYDQLRTSDDHRFVFKLPYEGEFRTVWRSVTNLEPALRHYGWNTWLTHEVFPLSTKAQGGGQWYPNYHLHLFAGGMTYARMVEWYEQHGAGHPELAAGTTVYAWHLLTEMIESNAVCCADVDGITDLLIFDSASILLWNQSWMKRPFGGRLEFTNWPGQATLALPSQRIENAYMMAMLRGPLPRSDDWKIMTTMGNAFLVGLSRRVGKDFWISASGGFDPSDNPIVNDRTGARTVELLPNAGVFFDRDGSLLVSFITKGGSTNGPTLNVYPGVIGSGRWSPGLWLQQVRDGGLRFGLVSRLGVGLGGLAR
jgi:hypothetical protein